MFKTFVRAMESTCGTTLISRSGCVTYSSPPRGRCDASSQFSRAVVAHRQFFAVATRQNPLRGVLYLAAAMLVLIRTDNLG